MGRKPKKLTTKMYHIRKHFQYTQGEMAEVLGVARVTVSNLERGARKPGPKVLKALQELGVNTGWLLDGVGKMLGKECRQVGVKAKTNRLIAEMRANPYFAAYILDAATARWNDFVLLHREDHRHALEGVARDAAEKSSSSSAVAKAIDEANEAGKLYTICLE